MAGCAQGRDAVARPGRNPLQPARIVRDADRLGGGTVMREMRNELNWPPAVRRAGGGALGRIGALGLLAVLLTVSGCAQQKPATQLELVPAKLLNLLRRRRHRKAFWTSNRTTSRRRS